MRKKIARVINETIQESFKNYILVSLKCTGFVILFLFLIKSISMSQSVSSLYFQIFSGDKQSEISFLKQIKGLPEYDRYLSLAISIYGESIDQEIKKDFLERQAQIESMEAILKRNPKARDVLYGLFRLYDAQGDKETAINYLKQAKAIDPTIQ